MKRITIPLCLGLAFTSLATAQTPPAGWKVIKDNGKGKCQMAVPAAWKEQDLMGQRLGMAKSPDGTGDAVVNLMENMPWKEFQQAVFMTYHEEKDKPKIEDSPKRLWFEITSMGSPSMTKWYVATPADARTTCNAQVNFKKGDKKAEEAARRIVEAVRGG